MKYTGWFQNNFNVQGYRHPQHAARRNLQQWLTVGDVRDRQHAAEPAGMM
jgi:hypothetical protein